MAHFVIKAYDFVNDDALAKRLLVRPDHLQRMKEEKERGIFLFGGALLNEEENMTGSLIVVNLPDMDAVKKWIEVDPYKKQGVWENVLILRFRLADV